MTARFEKKDIIKYGLYKLLVKLTGRTLPWGNLTGIRPVKLAMAMIESGMKNSETAQEMREQYLVSPEKTALAVAIANREDTAFISAFRFAQVSAFTVHSALIL